MHHVRGVAVAGDRHRYGVFPLPAEHVQRQLGRARLPFIAGEGRALDAPCEHEQCHQKADGEAQHTPHDGGLENETEDQAGQSKEKASIQFNLNKESNLIYYDVLRENNAQNESEFMRSLLIRYATNPKNKRELFIFKESVERLNLAIKDKKSPDLVVALDVDGTIS